MGLKNLFAWGHKAQNTAPSCGTACGAGDKPEKPSACGSALRRRRSQALRLWLCLRRWRPQALRLWFCLRRWRQEVICGVPLTGGAPPKGRPWLSDLWETRRFQTPRRHHLPPNKGANPMDTCFSMAHHRGLRPTVQALLHLRPRQPRQVPGNGPGGHDPGHRKLPGLLPQGRPPALLLPHRRGPHLHPSSGSWPGC